jgi:hypothetical protein
MDEISDISIEEIAQLIALLRPAPDAWVQAAQSLPALQRDLEPLVEQWQQDAAARAAVLADLEQALRAAGVAPDANALRYVRLSLEG